MGYRLKDLYEWYEDSASNRTIIKAISTGKRFIFNDDGSLRLPDGGLDLAGNALTNVDWANSDAGSGSGLDADTLDGSEPSSLTVADADTVDGKHASDLGGEPNVPGWEEDANSPLTGSNTSSATLNFSQDWDRVLIIPHNDDQGFQEMRVNGVSTADYKYVDNADTATHNVSKWALGTFTRSIEAITLKNQSLFPQLGMNVRFANTATGVTVAGHLPSSGFSGTLDSVTLLSTLGNSKSVTADVYGYKL